MISAMMSRTGLKKVMTHDEALKAVDWIEPANLVA